VSLRGNLHAAWRWPLIEAPGDDLVPLGVGVAVARALGRFGVPATVKWPNDILLGQRKLGGLLVERYQDFVFVGLGLNLGTAPDLKQLDPDAAIPPTCLAEHGLAFDLGSFWDELCDEGQLVATKLGTEAGREELRGAHSRLLDRGF
jgi:BirA family biotin operon repressor/biotin-[acetyl-CoA-carboxylase] ligase